MLQTYRLREDAIAPMQRRVFVRQCTLFAVVLPILGIVIAWSVLSSDVPITNSTVFLLGVLAVFLLVGGVVSVRRNVRRQGAALRSYEVLLAEDSITRRIEGHSDITLPRDSITAITESAAGGLTVCGASLDQTIFIPAELAGLEELRATLASTHSITTSPGSHSGRMLQSAVVPAVLIVAGLAFFGSTPAVVVPAATVLTVILGWSAWRIVRSPHYDQRLRRRAAFYLLPALAALVRAGMLLFQ